MSLKAQKIGSMFTREISRIILEEIKDPEIKFVTLKFMLNILYFANSRQK